MNCLKRFLSYVPSHCNELPPVAPAPQNPPDPEAILGIVPVERQKVYDARKLIYAIANHDSMFELKPRFARVARPRSPA